jgi:thiosulfate/3-mercaptopyruvate sulfurtransferase
MLSGGRNAQITVYVARPPVLSLTARPIAAESAHNFYSSFRKIVIRSSPYKPKKMEETMKNKVSVFLSAAILIAASSVFARTIDPIVSVDWLAANAENVVIVDVRPESAYNQNHIPGAINEPWIVPVSAWIVVGPEGQLLEMPADDALEDVIGNLGIQKNSKVVVVNDTNPGEPAHYGPAGATRVALTLVYAGVPNVAILSGGTAEWTAKGNPLTTDVPVVEPSDFTGCFDTDLIATIDDVDALNYAATLVDARDADVYFGATIEPYAPVAGHIPGATSLPGPFAFKTDEVTGNIVFQDLETLDAMAEGAIKTNWPFWVPVEFKEVIVYCGVGGYASIWTYVLQEALGYKRVRMYDGSAQEWVAAGYDMRPFIWEW